MRISKNSVVSIEFTLTDDEGEVLDTSKGEEPLSYIHGVGDLVIGLEKELEGKKAGDSFQVSVSPEEGYGAYDAEQISVVSKSMFEGVETLAIGMEFQSETEQGMQIFSIIEIEGDDVTIDGNHPLAGETLNFEVTVIDVRAATSEELLHGHIHGEGCHHHG
ncbi:peptidylprolyl isomerase [Deltaproteobacteria bacterium TL4]